jgi:hypothetical protein
MRLLGLIIGGLVICRPLAVEAADIASSYTATGDRGRVSTTVVLCPSADGSQTAVACLAASYQPTYQLLGVKAGAGSTMTGAAVLVPYAGAYLLPIYGAFNGASAQLQTLAADGVTWLNSGPAVTSSSIVQVQVGAAPAGYTTPNWRIAVTGAGYTLWAEMDWTSALPLSGSLTALPRGPATYIQTSVSVPANASTLLIGANPARRKLDVIPNASSCTINDAGGTASATSKPIPGGWTYGELDPPPNGAVYGFCPTATTISVTEGN